eukprot:gene17615-19369_t
MALAAGHFMVHLATIVVTEIEVGPEIRSQERDGTGHGEVIRGLGRIQRHHVAGHARGHIEGHVRGHAIVEGQGQMNDGMEDDVTQAVIITGKEGGEIQGGPGQGHTLDHGQGHIRDQGQDQDQDLPKSVKQVHQLAMTRYEREPTGSFIDLKIQRSPKLTPQEKLKLRMQKQLTKQIKQDKQSEKKKQDQKEKEKMNRDNDIYEIQRKIRYRGRQDYSRDRSVSPPPRGGRSKYRDDDYPSRSPSKSPRTRHYEKICLQPEANGLKSGSLLQFCKSEKNPLKSHPSSVQNDMLSSKERISPRTCNNGPSSRRSEYSSSQSKSGSKAAYPNSSQRQRDTDSPSVDRNSSSVHSRHSKTHNNNDDDNFEWTTHISSSGKTYYYNKRSEKSQWEKPKEWIERENKIRAREREKRNRECSSRDSRESSKYPKISPFKKDYISSRNSPYAKRNQEYSEVDRSRPVKTYGSSTSAASTTSSRSSGCPTPETNASPMGSVQDISPPSTPSNSAVTSLSPFVNASTAANQSKYSYSDPKSLPSTPNSHGSLGLSHAGHATPKSNCTSTVVATSTASLHPLQQAMLLQQQQIVAQQTAYANPSVSHLAQQSYGQTSGSPRSDVKRRSSDAGPPPPPPQQQQLHQINKTSSTPPPPPPPHQMDASAASPGLYNSSRYGDPRTANSKVVPYMPPYNAMYNSAINADNGGWDVGNQNQKITESPLLPDLPDLTSYSQFCSKQTFDEVAGWMGCILERQAAMVCNEVDSGLGIASEKSKSNFMISNLASFIADTRQQVASSRLSCVSNVLQRVEGLQDLRIERQDSKSRRSQDSQGDPRTTGQSEAKTVRRDSTKSS